MWQPKHKKAEKDGESEDMREGEEASDDNEELDEELRSSAFRYFLHITEYCTLFDP